MLNPQMVKHKKENKTTMSDKTKPEEQTEESPVYSDSQETEKLSSESACKKESTERNLDDGSEMMTNDLNEKIEPDEKPTSNQPSTSRAKMGTSVISSSSESRSSISSEPIGYTIKLGSSNEESTPIGESSIASRSALESVRNNSVLESDRIEEVTEHAANPDTISETETGICAQLRSFFANLCIIRKKREKKTLVEYLDKRKKLKETLLKDSSYRKLYNKALEMKSGLKNTKYKPPKNPYRLPIVTRGRRCKAPPSHPTQTLPTIMIKKSAENPEARKILLHNIKDAKSPFRSQLPSPLPSPRPSPGKRKHTLPAAQQQSAFRQVQGKAVQAHLAEVFTLSQVNSPAKTSERDAKKIRDRKRKRRARSCALIIHLRHDLMRTFRETSSHLRWNPAGTGSSVSAKKNIRQNDEGQYEETSFIHKENGTDHEGDKPQPPKSFEDISQDGEGDDNCDEPQKTDEKITEATERTTEKSIGVTDKKKEIPTKKIKDLFSFSTFTRK